MGLHKFSQLSQGTQLALVVRQKKESFLSCQFVYLPDICWVDWVNLLLIFNEDIFSLMCIIVYNIASKPHFLTTLQNYLYNSHGTRVATYQGSRIFIYFILYFILFFDFEYVKNMQGKIEVEDKRSAIRQNVSNLNVNCLHFSICCFCL